MRRNMWFVLVLASVVCCMLFTFSCAKKTNTIAKGSGDMAALSVMEPTAKECPPAVVKEKEEPAPGAEQFVNENIYFNYDSAELSAGAQEILKRKAGWLRENSKKFVTIEGHCDERGTNEYNLALGDRRAQSAKTFLVDTGISADRISTISYGEERPLDSASNEGAWSKNRRAHFLID
jgi:peptidoglycan-associated lipoprotein